MNVSSSGVSVPKGSTEDACDRDAAHRESIARLYREHNQALLKFLRLRVDSDQEAQEVAQEAYVRMLQLESTRAVSFLSSYLFRIAVNIAIDRHRRKSLAFRSSQEVNEHQTVVDVGSDIIAQAREEIGLIGRFIEELPPKRIHLTIGSTIAAQPAPILTRRYRRRLPSVKNF